MMNKISTISASDARADLYNLIKSASLGMQSYEIILRGSEPVILMSKADLESWIETLDVMSSPNEVAAIRESRESDKTITLDELLTKMENRNHGKGSTSKRRVKTTKKTSEK